MTVHHTHVLVSLPNLTPGAPALVLLDIEERSAHVLRVPADISFCGGISGLAISHDHVFAIVPDTGTFVRGREGPFARPSKLLVFDRRDLSLLSTHVLSLVLDGHSILVHDDGLLVVSTGTDEVIHVRMNGARVLSERIFWRADALGPKMDAHHLNAISVGDAGLFASGFGKKTGQMWSSATEGFVASLPAGDRIATRLGHPHSILNTNAGIVFCESVTATVRILGTDARRQLDGYTRGACLVGDRLFVGTSKGRKTSKSTGLANRSETGEPTGRCAVTVLSFPTLDIEHVIDLDDLGFEIYDLHPVSDVSNWPVVPPDDARKAMLAGLRAGYDERDSTVSWLHGEVGLRDAEIARLHAEVAARDEEIVRLQSTATAATAGNGH